MRIFIPRIFSYPDGIRTESSLPASISPSNPDFEELDPTVSLIVGQVREIGGE